MFSAGDLRIKRGEGDTDGEVIKKITSGDNKSVEKMCETENSVSQRTEPSRANARAPTKGFSSLKVRGYRQKETRWLNPGKGSGRVCMSGAAESAAHR